MQLTSVQQCATGKFHPRYYNDGKTFFISQSLMLKSFVGALISSNCHQFSIWIEKTDFRFDLNCIIAYYFSIQKHSNIRINNYDVKNVSFNHFKGIDMDGNVILFISLMLRLLCFRFYITHFFLLINMHQFHTTLYSFVQFYMDSNRNRKYLSLTFIATFYLISGQFFYLVHSGQNLIYNIESITFQINSIS